MWYFLYVILCFTTSAVMTLNGFGLDTWQWWCICACQALSYVCGVGISESRG